MKYYQDGHNFYAVGKNEAYCIRTKEEFAGIERIHPEDGEFEDKQEVHRGVVISAYGRVSHFISNKIR